MAAQSKKFLTAAACLLFVFSASMGFLLTEIQEGKYNFSEQDTLCADTEPQKPRQFCWTEQYDLCTLHQLACQPTVLTGDSAVEEQLREVPLSELVNRYPLPEWSISQQDNMVTICHNIAGLCPEHRQMYHLGVNENGQYVAVYYGPSAVGSEAGAFLVTDVPVNRLSPQQCNELQEGVYEYYSQDELIAMLDNFSEL